MYSENEYISHSMGKGGLMHLRIVSVHMSMRNARMLTWIETFRYFYISLCLSIKGLGGHIVLPVSVFLPFCLSVCLSKP